jgi:molecular chaperone GrpE (heat shock protein)
MSKKIKKLISEQELELSSCLKEILRLNNLLDKNKIERKDEFINLIIGIIDVIDTFEKSEEVILEKGLNNSDDTQKILNRFSTVSKKLHKLIRKYGITKLEFPDNRLIVGYCEVIDTEPDSTLKNDTILEVVKNGYIYGKELIREAEVIIVKN